MIGILIFSLYKVVYCGITKMKIGMTVEPFEGVSAGNLISFAHALALDHIELNINSMSEVDAIIENIGKFTTTFHLPIIGTDKFELGCNKKENQDQIKDVISFINTNYKSLNMMYALAHPPECKDATFETLMENLQQIEIPIILENIPWQKDEIFIDFYFKAKDILGKQLAGHAIDAPHRFLTYFEKWLEVPKRLIKEIVYVHLQDTTRKDDDHLPIGQGEMPYKDFINFLKSINYKGVINQEIKPKGLDIDAIMQSCLNVAKAISFGKYLRLKSRYTIVKPILKRKINQALKKR
ncbi:MAG: sugar phosphate isomerase/epimerase [Asgard group archaeon]|nr:sugar phosphate isomerase/epimerase [Asgard group archaeon]